MLMSDSGHGHHPMTMFLFPLRALQVTDGNFNDLKKSHFKRGHVSALHWQGTSQ